MPTAPAIEIVEPAGSGGGPAVPPPDDNDRDRGGGDSGGDPEPCYSPPQGLSVTGIIVGLAGVVMFFSALVSAFIVRKGLGGVDWRPFEFPRILWLNTLILLASSFTIVRSRSFLLINDAKGFRHWWVVTAILGLFFVAGQLIAWQQLVNAGVYLAENPASSFFYVFTAAHGLHLLGGIVALVAVAFRKPLLRKLAKPTEAISIYWHFMDAMWLFLFFFLLAGYHA
jgi:cytochrome c oxidase subunit III